MSSCTSIDLLVTPYIDGELAGADCRVVEDHIGVCASCRGRVAAERVMRQLLLERRPSLQTSHAPAALCARVAALRERGATADAEEWRSSTVSRLARSLWAARIAPLAAAATLVLLVGGAFLYAATAGSARVMAAELAADHVKCFTMNAVLGTHQTADEVERAMAESFDWPMTLPDGAAREELSLVGSRPCVYGEGRIAHIMYRHNGVPVSLFMLPQRVRSAQTLNVLGHACAIWSDARRTFVLVSRETPADAQKLATLVQASLR